MLRFFYIVALLFFLSNLSINAQEKIEKEFSYISDFAWNLQGGNRTGFSRLGCLQASLFFDTEALNLWKNGKFKFSYLSAHGKPFSEITGDFQIASNIEAGSIATTFELWYRHHWNSIDATIGFIDLNAIFSYSDLALTLINSSFGIQPTISGNMPVPIYPLTSLGAVLDVKLNKKINLKVGLFDGTPTSYSDFQLLPDLRWNDSEGIFMITELTKSYKTGSKPGIIKAGYWMHSQNISSHHQGIYSMNHGFYIIGEQEIVKKGTKSLNVWGKFGCAPRDCNIIRFFNGSGISFINYTGRNENDVIAIGYGQAIYCNEYKQATMVSRNETVVELTISKQIGVLTLQPDFQYIIHPYGNSEKSNPFCFIMRFAITL